jgi:hypothetical protein
MKKLFIALCSLLSLQAIAKENITNYVYNIQIVDDVNKNQSPKNLKLIGSPNEPVTLSENTEYAYDENCGNDVQIKSSFGSITKMKNSTEKLDSGIFLMLHPKSEIDGKLKLESFIRLSSISSMSKYNDNGCMIPLYDITSNEIKNIYDLNIGDTYSFKIGERYHMQIKVEKKSD